MFQMKNLANEKDRKEDTTDSRAKSGLQMKRKSKKSPSKIVNYKEALRSRLMVKQGIFPQAIKTNIMSRDVRTVHSPKIPANLINRRLNSCNVLNKLFCEEKSSNEPSSNTPSKSERRESFCITSYQCEMSVNATTSPLKSAISSDSPKFEALQDIYVDENSSQSSTSMMNKQIEACMPSTDFSYYSLQQAHSLLLYKEMCQILKKTMIMEKVKHFDNFPDMVQEVRNKLWKVRSARDKNSNPDGCPSVHYEENTSDTFSYDDEFCRYRSSPNFHSSAQSSPNFPSPMQSSPNFNSPMQDFGECNSPERVDIDDASAPLPFELKVPRRSNLMESGDGIDSEAVVDECTLTDSDDERDEQHMPAYHLRSVKFKWNYQHSIFSSTLIPTCKLDHNLTMNPIEFLENLSKASDNKNVQQTSYDFNVRQSTYADSSPKFGNYGPPHRGSASKWLRGIDVEDPQYKETSRCGLKDNSLADYSPNGYMDISMEHPYRRVESKESGASEIAQPMGKNQEISSDPDYFFSSLASANTPEMKYYPCRLY